MIIVESHGICERRYSSNDVKIRQVETGTLWNDAVDTKPCAFTYIETDIPTDYTITEEDLSEAGRVMMGLQEEEEAEE